MNRGHQRPHETTGQSRDRLPLRPGDPDAPGVERRESSHVVAVQVREDDSIEVAWRKAAACQLGNERLLG